MARREKKAAEESIRPKETSWEVFRELRGPRTQCLNEEFAECEVYHHKIASQFQDLAFVILLPRFKITKEQEWDRPWESVPLNRAPKLTVTLFTVLPAAKISDTGGEKKQVI